MLCDQEPGKVGKEFFKAFSAKAVKRRIPLLGGIELTSRCNLNCVHCYVSHQNRKAKSVQKELSDLQWMNLIDQATDAGCLNLLFTGGETFLRPDFSQIYSHARKNGLVVTVFTNGTLIDDRIIETFAKYPPNCVEISLYGLTAKTYEQVTGVAGSFEKCMQGIYRLKENGFLVKLKTMMLSANINEFNDMEKFAAGLDVPFRSDAMVYPRLDSDKTPMKYRVSPKDAVKKEFSDPTRSKDWHNFFKRMETLPVTGDLYQCGAGLTMFHIDSTGKMSPCLMAFDVCQDLLNSTFKDAWYSKKFERFRENQQAPAKCRDCELKCLCGYCPGFFELETGSKSVHSEFLCEIGKERKQAIDNLSSKVS